MGSKLGRELSLDGAALHDLKTDFNTLLTRTIRTMREKNVEEAAVTAKLEITLTTSDNPNLYAPDSAEERERVIPEFKHKVTATMKIKEEAAGETGGEEYELLYDSDVGAFVMVVIKDKGQTSLWEGDAGEKPTQEITVDDVIETATAIVREANSASVALLQRRMGIQYQLASAILDRLEEQGVVGPSHGSAPREVLPYGAEDGGESA